MEHDRILNAGDEVDLDALRCAYLPVIQKELDYFRAAHNRGYKPGVGKPAIVFNRGALPEVTDICNEDLHIPSRLPFPIETLRVRDGFVRSRNPQTPLEEYHITRQTNQLLLEQLLR